MAENGKSAGPDIATLEREGKRLHHVIATEGLGKTGTAPSRKADPPKREETGKSGY